MSWAVPKGLSVDPEQKRLAIQTEDHPLRYTDFEGVIQKGNCGAGTVIVWDMVTYDSQADIRQQHKRGKIIFRLQGQKVSGAYALNRMKSSKNQRLIIKTKDK
jgi:bifunctional non-homologous end joining protein LigD